MRGYFEFLLNFPNVTFEEVKLELKKAKAGLSYDSNITQMDFIERYILSPNKKIEFDSESNDWELTPDKASHRGTLFLHFVDVIAPELLYDRSHAQRIQDELGAKLGELTLFYPLIIGIGKFHWKGTAEATTDGGRSTRSNAAFFGEPPLPIFANSLVAEMKQHIVNVREYINDQKLGSLAQSSLKILMNPYLSTMSNLIGPVHSITENTINKLVNKLDLSDKSVLLECGSGAPFLGLQASIFVNATICLDLPCVMKTIFWILSFLKAEDRKFAQTIHYIACFEFSSPSLF